MEVLNLNRKILRLLGMCLKRDAMRREFYLSAFANVCILAIILIFIGESVMFFFNNLDDIRAALFSLMQAVALIQICGAYVSLISNKNAIFDFFDELQRLTNDSEYTPPNSDPYT